MDELTRATFVGICTQCIRDYAKTFLSPSTTLDISAHFGYFLMVLARAVEIAANITLPKPSVVVASATRDMN